MKDLHYIEASPQPWGLPLFLAVGIHLLALLPALISPHLSFFQRQRLPEIQTVTLFNVADLPAPGPPQAAAPPQPRPQPQPQPQPRPQAPPEPPPPPPVEAETPPPTVAPEPPPAPPAPEPRPEPPQVQPSPPAPEPVPAAPAQPRTIAPSEPFKVAAQPPPPISTRPLRTRETMDEVERIREAARLDREAREAARRAEEARRAALDAARTSIMAHQAPPRREISQREPAAGATTPAPAASEPTTRPTGARAGGGEVTVDAATREYLSRLHNHIQAHWTLPDLPSWDRNLVAVVVIHLRRDGTVRNTVFEKRTENLYFNQLVERTLRDAAPMPAFPAALRESEMEVGLRFRPGEVF